VFDGGVIIVHLGEGIDEPVGFEEHHVSQLLVGVFDDSELSTVVQILDGVLGLSLRERERFAQNTQLPVIETRELVAMGKSLSLTEAQAKDAIEYLHHSGKLTIIEDANQKLGHVMFFEPDWLINAFSKMYNYHSPIKHKALCLNPPIRPLDTNKPGHYLLITEEFGCGDRIQKHIHFLNGLTILNKLPPSRLKNNILHQCLPLAAEAMLCD
jgi:hypothetical protein